MDTKVYKGTIDRWLDYRIEEVREMSHRLSLRSLPLKLSTVLLPIPSGKAMVHSVN